MIVAVNPLRNIAQLSMLEELQREINRRIGNSNGELDPKTLQLIVEQEEIRKQYWDELRSEQEIEKQTFN